MIKEFSEKWDKYKGDLEKYFRNTKQTEYNKYGTIVKVLFKIVINREGKVFDIERMTIIDDGDYQGTKIFIIPLDTYQPTINDYVVTNTYYGSCSGCDTLQAINKYEDELPNERQVKEYMVLALHLLQKCKWIEE